MKTSANPMTNNKAKYNLTSKINTMFGFMVSAFLLHLGIKARNIILNDEESSLSEKEKSIDRIMKVFNTINLVAGKALNVKHFDEQVFIVRNGSIEQIKQGEFSSLSVDELSNILIEISEHNENINSKKL